MSLKGEVSTWIWIAAITTVGAIIFMAGMGILEGYMSNSERESDSNEFSDIVTKIKFVCQGDAENIYPHEASFSNEVKAVYSTNVIEEPPDKVSVLISEKERSEGEYVCIKFSNDEEPYCEEIFCNVDMNYIGTPSLEDTLASRIRNALGKGDTYKYDIVIEKGRDGIVYLDADEIMPVGTGNLCGNGEIDVGEECDSNTKYCEPLYGACSRLSCVSCACEASLDCDYCDGPDEFCVEGSDWMKYCMEDISECYDNAFTSASDSQDEEDPDEDSPTDDPNADDNEVCDTSRTYDDQRTVYVTRDGSGDYNCDGTNDEAEINQAIERVSSDSAYDTVFLKGPATYLIDSTINMMSNVVLTGDSDAKIMLIDDANWLEDVPLIRLESVENAAIRCFEIDGNRDNNRYITNSEADNDDANCCQHYYMMMYMTDGRDVEIDNMYMHHNWDDIIQLKRSDSVKFHDNTIRQPGCDVLYAIRSSNVEAYDNYIRIYCNSGIRPDGTTNMYIYDNDIARDEGAGGYAGIEIQGAATVWMCNNNIHDTASKIVDLSDGEATLHYDGCTGDGDEEEDSEAEDECADEDAEGQEEDSDGSEAEEETDDEAEESGNSDEESRDVTDVCDTSKTYDDARALYVAPKGGNGDYVCDGTNDEAEINQAISRVSSDSAYDTVFLKEGTYNIDSTIALKSNVVLTGDTGAKIRLINNANWLPEVPMLMGEDVSDVAIRCFEIDGNRDNNRYVTNSEVSNYDANCGKEYYNIMHFVGSSDIEIDNMYLHHNWNDIVKFSRGDNLKFLNNNVRQPGHDIVYGFRATNVWVGHNFMRIYCNSGARCDTCDNFYVYDNDIARDDGAGGNAAIELQGGSPDGGDMDVWVCDNTIGDVRCVYDLEDGESCWTDRAPNNPFDGVIHTDGCPTD